MNAVIAMTRRVPWLHIGKGTGTVLLIFLTAYLTYLGTARSSRETAVQQQRLVQIQQFEESGARLDADMSTYVDALLDHDDLNPPRRELRVALALHASQAQGLKDAASSGNIDRYLEGLGRLREMTDAVDLARAHLAAQEHLNLMDFRVRLVKQLKHNATIS